MRGKPKTDLRLPPGLSPAEEAEWWDAHPEYWQTANNADELIEPSAVRRTKPVSLRLPTDLIDQLKRAAARRDVPYQTLIRMWLRERLESETN